MKWNFNFIWIKCANSSYHFWMFIIWDFQWEEKLEQKSLYFYAMVILLFRININEDIIHFVKSIELNICCFCRRDSTSWLVEINGRQLPMTSSIFLSYNILWPLTNKWFNNRPIGKIWFEYCYWWNSSNAKEYYWCRMKIL